MQERWNKTIQMCGLVCLLALILSGGCREKVSGFSRDEVSKVSPGDNLVYVSWGDQIMVATGDAQLDTEDKIERCVAGWAKHS